MFEPYTGKTKTAVSGGKQLIQFKREGKFDGNFLASCDAIDLYPSILVEEGLQLLDEKIHKDDTLQTKTDLTKAELVILSRLCTEGLYFECKLGFSNKMGEPKWADH